MGETRPSISSDPALGPAPDQPWHALPADQALAALGVDPGLGLSATEAERRLARFGPNTLPEEPGRSLGRMVVDQLADPMIALLVVAAVVSGVVGEAADTIVIVVIVLLNAVIGVFQESRAERAMQALKEMSSPTAVVVRDGREQHVDASGLVPGDVVLLQDGAVVPADLRLLEAAALRISEAALTGESQPVGKHREAIHDPDAVVGDRRSMAFRGTFVAGGRGRGVTVGTGLHTELGEIAGLLATADVVRTPLQRRLARFGGWIALAVIGVSVVVFVAGLLRGEDATLMLLTAISLAVAAVPEALPAVVAVTLALGARHMARRNALVRRLPAVETLGSVTWICSDKTGTLTENRMRAEVVEAFRPSSGAGPEADEGGGGDGRGDGQGDDTEPVADLLEAVALCNDATLGSGQEGATGDPTEIALLEAAQRHGLDIGARVAALPRVDEVPFDSAAKLMVTFHARPEGDVVALVKGAPESVLPRCRLADAERARVLARAEELAGEGLRVLVAARAVLPEAPADTDIPGDLALLGLVGLIDPPRAEAAAAVAECLAAGVTPVMITGDHPATAAAIARRLGILDGGDEHVLAGPELARVSDEDLASVVERITVYARVDPEQKIRIVRALQANGECVAMTGDGVNDAPALRQAEIGVAMGAGGTDVAREAAEMVLLDDRFATIVDAVEEGRRIYDDIRKFIRYIMTGNSGEIWAVFLAPFLGMPVPLLPIHILWVNLVTDGLPGLALAEEPAEKGVMSRPPRAPSESVFARGLGSHVFWVGLLIGGLTLGMQGWALGRDVEQWQTMVFTVLAFSQLVHAMAIRSETRSLFSIGVLTNRPLVGAIAITVVLQLVLIYVPWFQGVFRTSPLTAGQLAIVFVVPLVVLAAVEAEKALVRRGWLHRRAFPQFSGR